SDGVLAEWLMSDGNVARDPSLVNPQADVVGIADFNGDGTNDILFRHADTGLIADWVLSNGDVVDPHDPSVPGAQIVGIGDFNGDGTSDILFQRTDGAFFEWLMSNGTVASNTPLGNPG